MGPISYRALQRWKNGVFIQNFFQKWNTLMLVEYGSINADSYCGCELGKCFLCHQALDSQTTYFSCKVVHKFLFCFQGGQNEGPW